MKQILSRIGWEIVEYLRRMATPFILNLMFGITMLAVMAIEIAALQAILIVLLFAGCCAAGLVYMRAAGESAYKMKEQGDARRAGVVGSESTANGKYRLSKEYRPYKGLTIGLAVCIIPIILILVAALAKSVTARAVMGFVCGWAYFPETMVYSIATGSASGFPFWLLWFGFVPIALYLACCTFGYELGANKERRRQVMLEQRSERIEEQKLAREARIEEQRRRNRELEERKKSQTSKTGKK